MFSAMFLSAVLGAPCDCSCHYVHRPVLNAVVSLPARAIVVPGRTIARVVKARPVRSVLKRVAKVQPVRSVFRNRQPVRRAVRFVLPRR